MAAPTHPQQRIMEAIFGIRDTTIKQMGAVVAGVVYPIRYCRPPFEHLREATGRGSDYVARTCTILTTNVLHIKPQERELKLTMSRIMSAFSFGPIVPFCCQSSVTGTSR